MPNDNFVEHLRKDNRSQRFINSILGIATAAGLVLAALSYQPIWYHGVAKFVIIAGSFVILALSIYLTIQEARISTNSLLRTYNLPGEEGRVVADLIDQIVASSDVTLVTKDLSWLSSEDARFGAWASRARLSIISFDTRSPGQNGVSKFAQYAEIIHAPLLEVNVRMSRLESSGNVKFLIGIRSGDNRKHHILTVTKNESVIFSLAEGFIASLKAAGKKHAEDGRS